MLGPNYEKRSDGHLYVAENSMRKPKAESSSFSWEGFVITEGKGIERMGGGGMVNGDGEERKCRGQLHLRILVPALRRRVQPAPHPPLRHHLKHGHLKYGVSLLSSSVDIYAARIRIANTVSVFVRIA